MTDRSLSYLFSPIVHPPCNAIGGKTDRILLPAIDKYIENFEYDSEKENISAIRLLSRAGRTVPLFSWHWMVGLQTKGHKAWAFLGIPIRVNLQFIVTVFVFLTYKCKNVHNVLATNHRRCKNHHWRLHVLWIVLFCCEPANRFGAARTETSHLMVCQSYFHSEIQNTCVNSCNNSITIHFEYNTQYSFRRRAVWILRGWGEKRSLCP